MMRIAIFLAIDKGGSPLQGGMERGLAKLGHDVQQYVQGRTYDLILVFNMCSHTTDYKYPNFPTCNTPIAFIDTAEYGYFTRLQDRIQRYANAFSEGSMAHDTKNPYEQGRVKQFLEGRSFPYFLHEYAKCIEYPGSYHPIDFPLYHLSAHSTPPNRDQYLRRPLDMFVAWGASHPWRMAIHEELRCAHTSCEMTLVDDVAGIRRLPQQLYFDRMEAAKVCPSYDGYGSGCFRMMEVLMRSCLLMAPLAIRTREPLVDGKTCLMYDVDHSGEDYIGSNVQSVLRSILADPEAAYSIYEAGYHHCMQHYTEKATAQYVLDTIEKHDWSKPTQLTVKAVGRPQ